VSGCGDVLVADEHEGIAAARNYLGYLPSSWRESPPVVDARNDDGR
jgi:acetyl-CoA carboxylase carboxyltransferase component